MATGGGPQVLEIANDHWQVGVLPGTGACLAYGRALVAGRWVDVLRPTRPAGLRRYPQCASYVLAPFSNRVRGGELRFGDGRWQLRRNASDGTAMHGAAHEFPWTVATRSADAVTLAFDSAHVVGANFPWTFRAEVAYALDGPRLSVVTTLTSTDDEAFPAGFGHHPFFQRGLLDPEVHEVEVRIPYEAAYPMVGAIPTGPPGPVPPHADHRELRPLGARFVDECLTARRPGEPVRIEWPRSGAALTMHADEVFSHLVLYVPRGRPFFAVEPVTNANDAFNLLADGVDGHGLFVLEPGESRSGAFHLDLEPLAAGVGAEASAGAARV